MPEITEPDAETVCREDHEIAGLFPLIGKDELYELAEDIQKNGLVEPIWIHEGKILDGRNRYRACGIAEVEPTFRTFDGDDPVGFVVSLNLRRRHLDESQRSMVAANIANLDRSSFSGNRFVESANWPTLEPQVSQAQAAEMLNVSERSIRRAKKVQRKAVPEIVEKVESGDLKVSTAAHIADMPQDEQQALAAMAVDAMKEAFKKAEKREQRRKAKEEDQKRFEAEMEEQRLARLEADKDKPKRPDDPLRSIAWYKVGKSDLVFDHLLSSPGVEGLSKIRDNLRDCEYWRLDEHLLKCRHKRGLNNDDIVKICEILASIGEIYRGFRNAAE